LVVQNKFFNLNSPFGDVSGSQSPAIHLALTYAPLLDPDTNLNKWFWVSLNGTTVSAAGSGSLIANTGSAIGWYLSQTIVKINVGAGFTFAYVQPTTQECTGSVTSGISVSAGAFGDQPTAGASFSNSYTQNISDIMIEDQSISSVLQMYTLSSSSGGTYGQPSDLLDHEIYTDTLYSVPDVATANLPIMTQGVWNAPTAFNGVIPLDIEIDMVLNFVELTGTVSPVWDVNVFGLLENAVGAGTNSTQTTLVGSFNWSIPFSSAASAA
jgi:hypothetical protein